MRSYYYYTGKIRQFFQENIYIFLLLGISILGYCWTLYFAPVYDFADVTIPSRYFFADALSHGIIPSWNPYQALGVPIPPDTISAIAYFPLWILVLIGGYPPVMWGVEFVLHAFLGGVGFYFLTNLFVKDKRTSFIVSCGFLLSGFFGANMQHLAWIISAAWIPWCLYAMIRLFEEPALKPALLLSLFASLLFTGGYPSFCFILPYIFVLLLVYHFFIRIKKRDFTYFKKILPMFLVSGIFAALLSLLTITSLLEIQPLISRGVALPYDKCIACPFYPQSLVSLVYPLITYTEPEFTGTDISMGNIYIGLLTLFFFVIGLFQKKNSAVKILAYWGVFSLLLCFADYTPIHKIAYHIMPSINMLRHPALFRIFVIIPMLLIAAIGLERFLHDFAKYRKSFFIFITSLFAIFTVISAILVIKDHSIITSLRPFSIDHIFNSSIAAKIVYSSIFHLCLLFILMIVLWCKSKRSPHYILAILVIDLILNTWVCTAQTGFSRDFTNKQLAEILDKMPKDYPIPTEITSSTKLYHEIQFSSLWKNLGTLAKQVEGDSYSIIIPKSHNIMISPYHKANQELLFPAFAYFPNEVIYSDTARFLSLDTAYTFDKTKVISIPEEVVSTIEIIEFTPNRIKLKTYSTTERPLVICQNISPRWGAKRESGEDLTIYHLNSTMIALEVPQGEENILIYYNNISTTLTLILQLIVLIALVAFYFAPFDDE